MTAASFGRWVARRRLGCLVVLAFASLAWPGCDVPAQQPHWQDILVEDPYRQGGTWLRANLHLHSTHSHGLLPAAELVELYRAQGYGVISITDHNQYGDQDGGVLSGVFQTDSRVHDWNGDGVTHPDHVYGSGVEAYVRDWTSEPPAYCRDRWFRPAGASITVVPLVLSGFEASYGYFGAHFGLVGFPPGAIDPPRAGFDWLGQSTAAGGFAYIAHPGDANGIASRFAAALPLRAFDGLEILNGAWLTGALQADATPLWDSLLTRGYRLWGLANDDAHYPPGAPEQVPFTAFNVILCPEPTTAAVLAALHRGAFYASTGLLFEELTVSGAELRARVPGAQQIRFVGAGGQILDERPGDSAVYRLLGHEAYVRIDARGDSVRAPHNRWVRAAWSQPFRVTSGVPPVR